ncbi:nucleoside kinase [Acetonema longum]|uniref:Phosphoribulokinase/uridine kinase n=1 Tax=Acetonema longum DSM 6540 TaxID=1009370 RepID=F7NDG2_9FIRM|nr:nucleoside kinase [Acetonema longum]EGO65915.1 phosphoribulokinase/uridine kinase [Acetonema longum DSM 6540]
MKDPIIVTLINGEQREYEREVSLLTIARDVRALYTAPIVAAKVNQRLEDLQYCLDGDCSVDFLDLSTETGMRVYQRSLAFVLIMAVAELFPQGQVTIEHSLAKGLYCELHLGRPLTQTDVEKLETGMRQIVLADRPFIKKELPLNDAIELFEIAGQAEKVALLKQLNQPEVCVYSCGEIADYVHEIMTPSTGYLKIFELRFYQPGLLLRFPRTENPTVLPTYVEQPKLAAIFQEAERWGAILGCGYVGTLNECIQKETVYDIIRVAEALHEKKIAQIADAIVQQGSVRVILVAGPSSSGKTTFAQRLSIQLRVNGRRPVPISLDDYFVDREHTPRDEQGEYDFEAIEAIDLPLFNDHLRRILAGEEVEIPSFNFKLGAREYLGHKIRISPEQPLIIEGIHGLNERLTQSIPREQKVKIYISALTQLAIDNHNRIPTTDTRLIRRIVRDSQFRSHDALVSLRIWPSVRRGEEKNIFPFQEEADIMFNSALIYELAILKRYAQPLLEQVGTKNPEYSEARRLLQFLEYFEPSGEEDVPPNSILREFIGQSCFYK